MDNLPIFLDLKDKPCLVVGGGVVAAQKMSLLCRVKAKITVVSPALSVTMRIRVGAGEVNWLATSFSTELVMNFVLAIAATGDDDVNYQVYQHAKASNILVNVTDNPPLCDFILPSILERSPIVVAVSSGGESPILARQLRACLETLIPPSYVRLGALVGRYRDAVKTKFSTLGMRRRFWESILQGPVADHVLAG